MDMLSQVKSALGITGSYQDDTIQVYIDEVIAFLVDAGVAQSNITSGIVARGVSDLWNYGSGEGKLSQYFMQRAIQLSKVKSSTNSGAGKITLVDKTIYANGRYNPADDNANGYSMVDVDVPDPALLKKTFTQNGTYSARDDGADGYSEVTIDVSSEQYSKGLNFFHSVNVHEYWQCALYGIGTCDDENINVPPISEFGYEVSEVTNLSSDETTIRKITFPSTVAYISAHGEHSGTIGTADTSCITILRHPPSLDSVSAFENMTGDWKIYVPASCVDAYKSATNWVAFADRIFPIQESR